MWLLCSWSLCSPVSLCAFVYLRKVMHGGSIRLSLSLSLLWNDSLSCALHFLGWQDNYIPRQTEKKTGNAQKFQSGLPSHCGYRLQDQATDLISTLPSLPACQPACLWNADNWKPQGKADTLKPRDRHSDTLCQKQLHILSGILGVLVTKWAWG